VIKYKNLTMIGTSHIAVQSISEVESFILKEKPGFVALELDKKRFFSLLYKERKLRLSDIKELGIKIFLLNFIGSWIEKKLGERVGIKPGSEMRKAIECSKKVGSRICLIDQDIKITLKNLLKTPFTEFLKLVIDSILGVVFKRETIKIDLRKVPKKSIINKVINTVKDRYPSIYKSLIEDRNKIMAKSLIRLMNLHKQASILAIVGAGHEDGIIKIIKNEV